MIPGFTKRKSAGGFLQEVIEVGMITWGYELLRCVNGFLGRCLNLRLVNPLQGFPFSVLVCYAVCIIKSLAAHIQV